METRPTGGTLADIYRAEASDPATALGYSLGTTSDPENFRLPRYSLHVVAERDVRRQYVVAVLRMRPQDVPRQQQMWQARYLVILDATKGNNHSIYVREGIYETNYTIEMDEVNQEAAGWRQKIAGNLKQRRADAMSRQFGVEPLPRVYMWVPALMATRSCAAEQEHLDDLHRAYDMTVGAFSTALEGATGRAASEDLAQQQAITAFQQVLPVAVRGIGNNPDGWSARYLALCAKSAGRDRGDHSFGLELVDAADVPNLTVTYLTGAQREENGRLYVKVITGTTRIPGTRTNDLIVY